mgnify:FL=1
MSNNHSSRPVVICVGGSDPSAHAGLQADLRVGQDLGVHIATIVSAITAQNSQEMVLCQPVELAVYRQQWQTIVDDMSPHSIKIGLLPTVELVHETTDWLTLCKTRFPDCQVILDPVGAASTGRALQDPEVLSCLLENVLPWVDVITPNRDEIAAIGKRLGLSLPTSSHPLVGAWQHYFSSEAHLAHLVWLVKGGHAAAQEDCVDWYFSKEQATPLGFSSPRLKVSNTRGTGCSFATALAAFLAQGYARLDALTLAKMYLNQALVAGYRVGKGAGPIGTVGWPAQMAAMPSVCQFDVQAGSVVTHSAVIHSQRASSGFKSLQASSLGLYPVVDSSLWIERLLKQGVKTIQLRVKSVAGMDIAVEIKRAVELGEQYQAKVFINDYWQLAIQYGAYGVHLGQEDLQIADLAAIAEAGLRLGLSTHGYFEIAQAQQIAPSYIALGHVFPTQTKDMPSKPQGLQRLAHYAALLAGHYPTVAIGGIGERQIESVIATGVDSVALVSAITKAENPDSVTQRLMGYFTDSTMLDEIAEKPRLVEEVL